MSEKKLKKLLKPNPSSPSSSTKSLEVPSTPEPKSAFDPSVKFHALLVNEVGTTALIYGETLEDMRPDIQQALDELAGTDIRMMIYQGHRLRVVKHTLEVVMPDGARIPLLNYEDPEETPDDGTVLLSNKAAAPDASEGEPPTGIENMGNESGGLWQ